MVQNPGWKVRFSPMDQYEDLEARSLTYRFWLSKGKRESYRRSDDQIPVFLPKVTDDPTITFQFFFRKLPTIRRSNFVFFESYRRSDDKFRVFPAITWCWHQRIGTSIIFRNLPMIRWSDFRRSSLRFIFEFTDDPMIRWSDDHSKGFLPTIRRSLGWFFAESYRRSDDQSTVFLAKVTDDPTITVSNFVKNSCHDWNPARKR